MTQDPRSSRGFLLVQVSRLRTIRRTQRPSRTRLNERRARPQRSPHTQHNTQKGQASMPSEDFEPAIPAIELPQTCAQAPGPATRLRTHTYTCIYICNNITFKYTDSTKQLLVSSIRPERNPHGVWKSKLHCLLQQVISWLPVPVLSQNNRLCALPFLLAYLTHSLP